MPPETFQTYKLQSALILALAQTSLNWRKSDMEFVKKFTPPDFQAKSFAPFISLNFDSFGGLYPHR